MGRARTSGRTRRRLPRHDRLTRVRALTPSDADVEIGETLVREYVVATAEELGQDVEVILTIVPDLADFRGRYFARGGGFLVAERGDAVRGGVGITPGDNGVCEMNRLWIRPPFRRAGLGLALSEAAMSHAKTLGFTRMLIDVAPSRAGALAMYDKLGFTAVAPTHSYPFEMVFLGRDL